MKNLINSESVRLEISGFIASITITKEKSYNAIDLSVLEGISSALDKIDEASDCRLVTLNGSDKAFVAGADIKYMSNANETEIKDFINFGQSIFRRFEHLPQPIVAVVKGFAIGGGLELALASDIIVANENAKFGLAETKLGLIPGFGGTQRLILRTDLSTTKRLVYSGETVSAEEACKLGIVDYLISDDDFESKLNKILKPITSNAPLAVQCAKRVINRTFYEIQEKGLNYEVENFLRLFSSKDSREGISAFIEKREAKFTGE